MAENDGSGTRTCGLADECAVQPRWGALGLRGKAASGIVKAMTERFDSEVQRLSGSFSLPAQRQAFQRLVQSRRAQMQNAVGGARAFGVRRLM